MPGLVSVAFEREPDYFLGHGIMGEKCVTMKAVERKSGKLAGLMCLASADRYINGKIQKVGYAGQVRIDRDFQGTMLPLRAFPYIRSLVKEGWPDLWFGAIVDDNPTAEALFVGLPRTSFPVAEVVSPIHTLALLTRKRFVGSKGTESISVERGNQFGREAIVAFLNDQGARREFTPQLKIEDLAGEDRTPGLKPDDFLVAVIDGRIAGICGIWDQSGFKQTVVHGYRGWLAGTRPIINSVGRLIGMKKLPGIGDPIASASLSFLAVADDSPAVFRILLTAALGETYSRGKDYLMAGFSQRDPLLKSAGKFRHILYRSTMYAFRFDGAVDENSYDRNKVPYWDGATV